MHNRSNLDMSTEHLQIKHNENIKTYTIRFHIQNVGNEDKLTENHATYRGNTLAETFVEHMVQVEERLITTLKNPLPFKRSAKDEHSFQEADRCFIYHFIDSFQFLSTSLEKLVLNQTKEG